MGASQIYNFNKKYSGDPNITPEKSIKDMKGKMMKEPIIVEKVKITDGDHINPSEGEIEIHNKLTEPKGSI
jgi:hypothetical protein